MQLSEFERLDLDLKIAILYEKAVYLTKRREGKLFLLLYQLAEFYVEIQYLKYRQDILCMRCFLCTSQLDPYLNELEVGWIFLDQK